MAQKELKRWAGATTLAKPWKGFGFSYFSLLLNCIFVIPSKMRSKPLELGFWVCLFAINVLSKELMWSDLHFKSRNSSVLPFIWIFSHWFLDMFICSLVLTFSHLFFIGLSLVCLLVPSLLDWLMHSCTQRTCLSVPNLAWTPGALPKTRHSPCPWEKHIPHPTPQEPVVTRQMVLSALLEMRSQNLKDARAW